MTSVPEYRGIPMPPAVAALPATRSGIPLPYTTVSRGLDNRDLSRLVKDASGDLVMVCSCKLGEGLPKLGKPCPHRQRRAMAERRCVVCGRRIGARATLVFLGVGLDDIEPYGPDTYSSIEPPAHTHCAAFSALACPRLAQATTPVMVALTRDYEMRKLVVIGFTDDGQPRRVLRRMTAPAGRGAVDMYAAIPRPSTTRFLPLDEWMRTEAPAPYRQP